MWDIPVLLIWGLVFLLVWGGISFVGTGLLIIPFAVFGAWRMARLAVSGGAMILGAIWLLALAEQVFGGTRLHALLAQASRGLHISRSSATVFITPILMSAPLVAAWAITRFRLTPSASQSRENQGAESDVNSR